MCGEHNTHTTIRTAIIIYIGYCLVLTSLRVAIVCKCFYCPHPGPCEIFVALGFLEELEMDFEIG